MSARFIEKFSIFYNKETLEKFSNQYTDKELNAFSDAFSIERLINIMETIYPPPYLYELYKVK
jgi:hypothetical protein